VIAADAKILVVNWGAQYLMSPGDADRNGVVDNNDAAILAAHWGTTSGVRWSDGDFNADGQVGPADASRPIGARHLVG
jgi:phosphoserine aminotransferase